MTLQRPHNDRKPFSVRRASGADSDAILACLRAAFNEYGGQYTEAAFAATVLTPESLDDRLRTMIVWVAATCDDHIIGTLTAAVIDNAGGICVAWRFTLDFRSVGLQRSYWRQHSASCAGEAVRE